MIHQSGYLLESDTDSALGTLYVICYLDVAVFSRITSFGAAHHQSEDCCDADTVTVQQWPDVCFHDAVSVLLHPLWPRDLSCRRCCSSACCDLHHAHQQYPWSHHSHGETGVCARVALFVYMLLMSIVRTGIWEEVVLVTFSSKIYWFQKIRDVAKGYGNS